MDIDVEINERVRDVRLALGLTQQEFGQKITVAQTYLSQIEKGNRDVTEKIQKLICFEFGVRREWLLTGQGSMFAEDDRSLLDQLAAQYNLDDFGQRFIQTFLSLPEAHRQIIKDFAYSLLDAEDSEKEDTEPDAPAALGASIVEAEAIYEKSCGFVPSGGLSASPTTDATGERESESERKQA